MAIMMSYDQVGKVEDISDIITNISPTATPFTTMIGTEGIHNTLFQWQEDSLQTVQSSPQVEGANAPSAVWAATVMRNSTTQIFSKVAQVSGTADAVKTYGRDRELAYQLMLRSRELKRDQEYAMVGTAQASITGSDTVARQMDSYQNMIDNGVRFVAGSGGGLGFSGSFPSRAALTEAMVLTTMQQLYQNGAEPNTLIVKPADAQIAAGWATASGRTRFSDNEDGRKVLNVVDVYVTPYGQLKIVLDRFIRGAGAVSGETQSDALIFQPDMWKRTPLRNWFRQTLAKVGDATQVQILGEFGLKHKNFKASGFITNIT